MRLFDTEIWIGLKEEIQTAQKTPQDEEILKIFFVSLNDLLSFRQQEIDKLYKSFEYSSSAAHELVARVVETELAGLLASDFSDEFSPVIYSLQLRYKDIVQALDKRIHNLALRDAQKLYEEYAKSPPEIINHLTLSVFSRFPGCFFQAPSRVFDRSPISVPGRETPAQAEDERTFTPVSSGAQSPGF